MIRPLFLSAALLLASVPVIAHADDAAPGLQDAACIVAAANTYDLPSAVVLILLDVEGGSLGRVSPNPNGTVDIGPMQVNQSWLPKLADHWHATDEDSYAALRDDFCANVEGGTWILRQAIDEAHGDLWEGVGLYHSHDPRDQAAYLRRVLKQALRLADLAGGIRP